MAQLFDREVRVNLGGTLVTSRVQNRKRPVLRVAFKIERSLQREPNTAEIQVYNLRPELRQKLQEEERIGVTLEAGYVEQFSEIFRGQVASAKSKREGKDWITTFQTSDSGAAFRASRVNKSLKGPVSVTAVIEAAADALGVDSGNFAEKLREGNVRGALREFKGGAVLSGQAALEVDKLAKTLGFSWSIQSGQLQFLAPGDVINPTAAVKLTAGTGLIGVPELGEKGNVIGRSLLQPELLPGKKIQIDSATISDAFFRISKVTIEGDTWTDTWYSSFEGTPA